LFIVFVVIYTYSFFHFWYTADVRRLQVLCFSVFFIFWIHVLDCHRGQIVNCSSSSVLYVAVWTLRVVSSIMLIWLLVTFIPFVEHCELGWHDLAANFQCPFWTHRLFGVYVLRRQLVCHTVNPTVVVLVNCSSQLHSHNRTSAGPPCYYYCIDRFLLTGLGSVVWVEPICV